MHEKIIVDIIAVGNGRLPAGAANRRHTKPGQCIHPTIQNQPL
jgi:hypothetical protein